MKMRSTKVLELEAEFERERNKFALLDEAMEFQGGAI